MESGASRTLMLWIAFVALTALLVMYELFSIIGIIDEAVAFQSAGANTRIVNAPSRIDGAACDALSREHDMQSAAFRAEPTQLKISAMKSVPLEQWIATPGIAAVLAATDSEGRPATGAGALVSEQVVELLGSGGIPIGTNSGKLTIAGVFPHPDDGRSTGIGFSAVYPDVVQEAPYDQCWVKSWPEHPEALSLLNSVVIPSTDPDVEPAQLTQWNTTLGASFDGAHQFAYRLSRFTSYVSLLIGVSLGFFAVRTRRLEIASALHAGVSTRALVAIQLLQQSVWVFLASVVVGSAAWVVAVTHRGSLESLMDAASRIIVLGGIGALGGVIAAVFTIRERALFMYFQNRS
ncbi:hypothetical protein [Leucobacter sp. USHLN153]|uniref:hypothetical protein n=1 Tax=Leucobacter sp. USHLN153 TaxID=3081268 RepID=UPI0030191510